MSPRRKTQCEFHAKLERIANSLARAADAPCSPTAPPDSTTTQGHCHILSVAAFEPNGKTADTPCGQWLREAGCDSVQDMAKQAANNPKKAERLFVAKMKECAPRVEGVPEISDGDLRQFHQGAIKAARFIAPSERQ